MYGVSAFSPTPKRWRRWRPRQRRRPHRTSTAPEKEKQRTVVAAATPSISPVRTPRNLPRPEEKQRRRTRWAPTHGSRMLGQRDQESPKKSQKSKRAKGDRQAGRQATPARLAPRHHPLVHGAGRCPHGQRSGGRIEKQRKGGGGRVWTPVSRRRKTDECWEPATVGGCLFVAKYASPIKPTHPIEPGAAPSPSNQPQCPPCSVTATTTPSLVVGASRATLGGDREGSSVARKHRVGTVTCAFMGT